MKMDNQVLVQMAERKLAAGALPMQSGPIYGGVGSGRACALCEIAIPASETELELSAKAGLLVFHPLCHAIYRELAMASASISS